MLGETQRTGPRFGRRVTNKEGNFRKFLLGNFAMTVCLGGCIAMLSVL